MTEQTKRLLNEFASALEAAGALARQIAEREPAKVVLEIDKKAIIEKVAANFLDDTRRITLDLGCQRPSESASGDRSRENQGDFQQESSQGRGKCS